MALIARRRNWTLLQNHDILIVVQQGVLCYHASELCQSYGERPCSRFALFLNNGSDWPVTACFCEDTRSQCRLVHSQPEPVVSDESTGYLGGRSLPPHFLQLITRLPKSKQQQNLCTQVFFKKVFLITHTHLRDAYS